MTKEEYSGPKHSEMQSIVVIILLLGAVGFRILLFPYENNDIVQFHIPWFIYLSQHNGLFAIKDLLDPNSPFQGLTYSPPYFYLMSILLPLGKWVSPVVLMKSLSIVFDFLSATGIFLIIRRRFPTGINKWAGFFVVCYAPTVVINSAYWGQVDGVFTSLLVFSLFFILNQRTKLSLVLLASAIAFKIQALILSPVFLILLFRKKISLVETMIIPLVYFLWMVPAYISGYPILAPFTAIFNVAGEYSSLTMNSPTIFAFVPNRYFDVAVPLGVLFAAICCVGLVWYAIKGNWELNQEDIIFFVVTIAVVLPYVLPKMHERYFYPATMFSILFFFFNPRLKLIPLALQVTSLLSYLPFLRGYELVPLFIPALINGYVAIVLIAGLIKRTKVPLEKTTILNE